MKKLIKFVAGGLFVGILGFAGTADVLADENSYISYEEEAAPASAAEPEAYRTTANLRLRSGPSLDASVIRTVPNGTRISVLDRRDGEWFSVNDGGTYGYMNAEFLWPAGQEPPAASSESEVQREAQSVNGVELREWSYMRNALPRNTPLQITDVRSGTVFWVQSFSHGNHADVETVSQSDTDTMRRVFGGWTWTPRPVWVTVNGRTFAASINGMPHAGSTISGNGMNGHVCLHFLNSRTHNGNRTHERDHQNAVQEAFRAA